MVKTRSQRKKRKGAIAEEALITLSLDELNALIDKRVKARYNVEKRNQGASSSSSLLLPSDSPCEQQSAISSSHVKVDLSSVLKLAPKEDFLDWNGRFERFHDDQMRRERFPSDEAWRDKILLTQSQ
uniref:Uncharacterized protein n=1 Tax=Chromera velia CCMP2878 TaxID=1169474 RepID=A0A0G4HBE8_9ALVE|eukprot:Cvel_25962.t1-p1 / transcript=Cvel_25962.t1 / gene=Cvel_25962 / organism=Chromera_velia_CCMP2878 / gene_product=hypothetical protein / transcript_product=hypothetical protein / location=Cvel_scaffold3011:7608-7985(+) / protein_length=126 / sequence_SO=supercontig / SO=protein_coding / is_pseudo=false